MRQPICSQRLKATCLIAVYGLRLDCALKGQRKQATSLLRQEQELGAFLGKIGIFLPLRTCCSATKLLLMRPVQAVKGPGVPLHRLPHKAEQTEVFSPSTGGRELKSQAIPPAMQRYHSKAAISSYSWSRIWTVFTLDYHGFTNGARKMLTDRTSLENKLPILSMGAFKENKDQAFK